ncbi:MAG: AraC family transcriptional regulator [Clostridia bacterium]|nr:AraC family transcriptional regulator [Clostridia bacterium]
MLAGGKTVSEVAEHFSFTDASSFSRSFKNVTGSSPSSVRKSRISSVPPALINL